MLIPAPVFAEIAIIGVTSVNSEAFSDSDDLIPLESSRETI